MLRPDALKITTGIRIYPHTPLARIAVAEGKISAGDNLLFPRGYLADAVSEWLPEEVRRIAAAHEGWVC